MHFDFATSHFPLGFEFQLLCDQNLCATYSSFCETFDGVGVRCRTGYCGDDGGGDNDTDHSGLYYDHEEMDGDRDDDGEQGDSDAFRGCVNGGRGGCVDGGRGDGGDGGDGGGDGGGGNTAEARKMHRILEVDSDDRHIFQLRWIYDSWLKNQRINCELGCISVLLIKESPKLLIRRPVFIAANKDHTLFNNCCADDIVMMNNSPMISKNIVFL